MSANYNFCKKDKHAAIYTAIMTLLAMLMLVLYSDLVGIFWAAIARIFDSWFNTNGLEVTIDDEVMSSLHYLFLIPLILGLISTFIIFLLIYEVFVYGVSPLTQVVGAGAILTSSLVIFAWSSHTAADLSKFPNDTLGLADPMVKAYVDLVYAASKSAEQARSAHSVLKLIHRRVHCCGVYNVDDYYTRRRIKLYGADDTWFTVPEFRSRIEGNGTYIAPDFCCRIPTEDCNKLENPEDEPEHVKSIWNVPCVLGVVIPFRNNMLNLCWSSAVVVGICAFYIIRVLLWKKEGLNLIN